MTRVQFWAGLGVGLGLGAPLGYALASLQRSSPPELAQSATSLPPPPAPLPALSGQTTAAADSYLEAPPRRSPPEVPRASHSRLPAAEVAALNKRTADLTKELNRARDRLAADTAPMVRPADLPERFSEQAIIAAVTSALREVRAGAQLSSVDCTEYPCIAYFRDLTEKDIQAMKQSRAYRTYANDRFRTLGRGGADSLFDAMVVWPENDTNPPNEFRARLRFRMGQMFQ